MAGLLDAMSVVNDADDGLTFRYRLVRRGGDFGTIFTAA